MDIGAEIPLPGGFFLAGAFVHEGDPGLGVLLVPLGGIALLAGVRAVATGLSRRRGSARPADADGRHGG